MQRCVAEEKDTKHLQTILFKKSFTLEAPRGFANGKSFQSSQRA